MTDREPSQEELQETFRGRLQVEREEIRAQSAGTSGDRAPVALDQQSVGRLSRMDALQSQAMAQASDRRRQARGTLIANALQRMEEGEYGYCLECGEFIGLKRLEVDPAAAWCVDCAGKAGR